MHRAVSSLIAQQLALDTLPVSACLPKPLCPPNEGYGVPGAAVLEGVAAAMVVYDTPDGMPADGTPIRVNVRSTLSGRDPRLHQLVVNSCIRVQHLTRMVLEAEGQPLPTDRYGQSCGLSVDGIQISDHRNVFELPRELDATLGSLGAHDGSIITLGIDHDAPQKPVPMMGRPYTNLQSGASVTAAASSSKGCRLSMTAAEADDWSCLSVADILNATS